MFIVQMSQKVYKYIPGIGAHSFTVSWGIIQCIFCSYSQSLQFNFSFHQVPIIAGWTEAARDEKFAQNFYTWPAVGIEPQTISSWI